jgi:hypothetical protein
MPTLRLTARSLDALNADTAHTAPAGPFDRGFQYDLRRLLCLENLRETLSFRFEFAFPLRNDHGSEAISQHVYGSASHVHEFIDAKKDEDRSTGK